MKHIFTIHSHVTFLATIGTIVHENLRTEDVIIICGSGYHPQVNEHFKGKTVQAYDRLEATFSWWQKVKHFNYTNSVNRYINHLTQGDDYVAYVDLMSVFNRYLVMHPECEQFHVIEEGIVNYADYDDFMLWTADLRQFQFQWTGLNAFKQILNATARLIRGRSLRLLAMPVHPNLYTLHHGVNAYCFSEYAFQYTSSKQKKFLDWTALNQYIDFTKNIYPDGSLIWIGDTLCSFLKVSMEHFQEAIKQFMQMINSNKEERILYLKFRGSESLEERDLTLEYLNQYNFKVVLIPSEVIMELVFLNGKNFTVYGIRSSLLIYANLMGHETHSLYPLIPNIYWTSLNKNYDTISKKVGFI